MPFSFQFKCQVRTYQSSVFQKHLSSTMANTSPNRATTTSSTNILIFSNHTANHTQTDSTPEIRPHITKQQPAIRLHAVATSGRRRGKHVHLKRNETTTVLCWRREAFAPYPLNLLSHLLRWRGFRALETRLSRKDVYAFF